MVSCFSSLGDASCFHVFPGKDRLSLPAQGKKIIFSGKKNITFLDNTRKIIFQLDFFGKTIFSGRLEKENMVFRAVSSSSLIHTFFNTEVLYLLTYLRLFKVLINLSETRDFPS